MIGAFLTIMTDDERFIGLTENQARALWAELVDLFNPATQLAVWTKRDVWQVEKFDDGSALLTLKDKSK